MSHTYKAGTVPDDPKELTRFLREELSRLEQALNEAQESTKWKVLHAAPKRYSEGVEVEADGTDWNPDGVSGAGKYVYRSGAWVFIG